MNVLANLFLVSLIVCCIYMTIVYLVALKIKNFSIVDIAWSAGFPLVVWCFGYLSEANSRNTIMWWMVTIWGFRLAAHLFNRIKKEHPVEEGRYQELRRKWQGHIKRNFFIFFLFQGVSIAILSLPFAIAFANPDKNVNTVELVAVVVWLVSISGEAMADLQLKRFKQNPSNKGKVCDSGLWNYSRHPNYFFEWMIWVSYFLLACTAPHGYLAIVSPAIILFLLLKVTGIPATEAQSLRSRGEAYKQYQKTTSVFVPWFKLKG